MTEFDNYMDVLADDIFQWGTGIIAGAGFSKAMVAPNSNRHAESWREMVDELVKLSSTYFGLTVDEKIDLDHELTAGSTLPQVITLLCDAIADSIGKTHEETLLTLKKLTAALVNWVPERQRVLAYAEILNKIGLSWVVTTNYDDVFETLLGDCGYPLSPNQPLKAPKDMIPIYHLHGSRQAPENLVLSFEDYIPLFTPDNYREDRLTTIVTEGPVLILGYSLSDLNVVSAIDRAKRQFDNGKGAHQTLQVEVNPELEAPRLINPQSSGDGARYTKIIIKSLDDFFAILTARLDVLQKKHDKEINEIKLKVKPFKDTVDAVDKKLTSSTNYLDYVKQNPDVVLGVLKSENFGNMSSYADCETFLSKLKAIKEIDPRRYPKEADIFNRFSALTLTYFKTRSSENGKFKYYKYLMREIFCLLEGFSLSLFSPRLIDIVIEYLDYVLLYADDTLGGAWAASRYWKTKAPELFEKHRDIWDRFYLQAQISSLRGDSLNGILGKFKSVEDTVGKEL